MRKGFTLIELLAVIVILAIIALIAVPIVINIIDDSKKSATLRSADFYLDAVELSIANSRLKGQKIIDGTYNILESGNICLEYTESNCTNELEVEVNGETPTSGTISITKGNISQVSIILNEKEIIKNDKEELIFKEQVDNDNEEFDNNYVCNPVTSETKTTGNVPKGQFLTGDEYICKVKEDTFYTFFVINSDENSVNLIMDRNLLTYGIEASWISENDYKEYNTDSTSCSYKACVDEGPVTALKNLYNATNDWENAEQINLTHTDENGRYSIEINGNARLPKLSELSSLVTGNKWSYSCDNETDEEILGYWTLETSAVRNAYMIGCNGSVTTNIIVGTSGSGWVEDTLSSIGIRPVINILKENIK